MRYPASDRRKISDLVRVDLWHLSPFQRFRYKAISRRIFLRYNIAALILAFLFTLPLLYRATYSFGLEPDEEFIALGNSDFIPQWCFYVNPIGSTLATIPHLEWNGISYYQADGYIPVSQLKRKSLFEMQMESCFYYFICLSFQFLIIVSFSATFHIRRQIRNSGLLISRINNFAFIFFSLIMIISYFVFVEISFSRNFYFYYKMDTLMKGFDIAKYHQPVNQDLVYEFPEQLPAVVVETNGESTQVDFRQFRRTVITPEHRFQAWTQKELEAVSMMFLRSTMSYLEFIEDSNKASDDELFDSTPMILEQIPETSELLSRAKMNVPETRMSYSEKLADSAALAGVDEKLIFPMRDQGESTLSILSPPSLMKVEWIPAEFRKTKIKGEDIWLTVWIGEIAFYDFTQNLYDETPEDFDLIERRIRYLHYQLKSRPWIGIILFDESGTEIKGILIDPA